MAGDWIPRQKGLSRKVEVAAIARLTGMDRRWVAETLCEFWDWCDSESADGCLGVLLEDLPALVEGTDSVFWQAVVSVGWLRVQAWGLSVPRFERWLGSSAKKRLKNTQRQWDLRKRDVAPTRDNKRDRNVTPVLLSPVLSCPVSGGGDGSEEAGGVAAPTNVQPNYGEPAARLANEWCHYSRSPWRDDKNPYRVAEVLQGLLDAGVPEGEISASIVAKGRLKTETLAVFIKRWDKYGDPKLAPRPRAQKTAKELADEDERRRVIKDNYDRKRAAKLARDIGKEKT